MGYKKLFILSIVMIFAVIAKAQDKPAYTIYTGEGKKISYGKMLKTLLQKDIVFFGEYHNNPICHWLELEIARDCSDKKPVILAAEMFERDNQEFLDQYLQQKITATQLDSLARLWSNYHTDYAPLVNLAKERRLPFIATNIPRRYASMVAKNGFEILDTLPEPEKKWMAPLPVVYDATLPGYQHMLTMMPGHASPNLPKAQAIKDATMAYSILQNMQPGTLMIHYNGAYHTENDEGIIWYVKKGNPSIQYATITTVSQKDINRLQPENMHKAQFIICVDEDMTTTYQP